jgi:hypothetical protein
MADDFHAQYAARKVHQAAVPVALALARGLVIDFNGQPMVDGEPPRDGLTCADLRTLVAEIDRLAAQVAQLHKDMREEQREFSREAREIAAEARWEGRQEASGDYGGY